jgi:hypothetical protein
MVITLVGLLDDGTPHADGQSPLNPRTAITIPRGGDVTIRLTVKTPQGEDVSLASPATLVLTVKKHAQDSKIFTKTPTIVNGAAEFSITPADMKQQDPGYFVYDIWRTSGGKTDEVMPMSPLYLEASARDVP